MNKKAQAAMEFLMTYGWAIVIVLAAIGALAYFGVLSPQKLLPERTTFQAPIPNVDNAVIKNVDNSIEIAFRNNKGVSITLPLTFTMNAASTSPCTIAAGDMSGQLSDGTEILITTQIPNGAGFLLKWDCSNAALDLGEKFKADISFDYINAETGQAMSEVGSVEGKYT